MRFYLFLFFLILPFATFSQDLKLAINPVVKVDSLYREDQFYFGFTLNTLQNKPVGLEQSKFSSGFSLGFLRDFPINKKRTIAIAPGIGLAYNQYNQNLKIEKVNQIPAYTILDSGISYDKNKFSQLLLEMPIEFRWRTSTYESHRFWRIYTGFKMGYLLYDKSIYQDSNGKIVIKNNKDFNKFQYGAFASVGKNTFNIFAYYGLNSLFDIAKTDTQKINMNSLHIGLMFYIL